ncbi:MAG: DUF3990 domain-containing protein [Pseudobutyrivibrio sp.]|nr:DUF3990 domain-containing protein [Pseudobutyrivibrio sp.]
MAKVILYHGSDKIIETPKLNGGKSNNDYGRGFYCTKHIELAKEWAVEEYRNGYVNKYEIDLANLKILNLNDKKYTILHWLTILLEHRTFRMNGPVSQDGLNYLKENYHIDISKYDVIIGYRADDSYFSFARGFISNSISVSQLEKAMYLGELGEQLFIQSAKAFSRLQFKEAIFVDSAEYFPQKEFRDKKAREDFNKMANIIDKNGVYILDLIRKEGSDNGTFI